MSRAFLVLLCYLAAVLFFAVALLGHSLGFNMLDAGWLAISCGLALSAAP